MIGDVLLISEKHTRAASQLKEIIEKRKAEKPVIAIAGESGSGKSEVAHELRRLLKKDGYLVKILHGDNYYKTLPTERNAWRKKHGIESIGENEYDWELLNGNIEDFRNGKESIFSPKSLCLSCQAVLSSSGKFSRDGGIACFTVFLPSMSARNL